ncbi:MAG TPA: hypothetical protein V6D33_02855 [Cyanophyceae cyanobacterium]
MRIVTTLLQQINEATINLQTERFLALLIKGMKPRARYSHSPTDFDLVWVPRSCPGSEIHTLIQQRRNRRAVEGIL